MTWSEETIGFLNVLIATPECSPESSDQHGFWCNFWCMLLKQQVTSYQPCPVMAKGSCLQTALNSYRLMCVTSAVKDFSSEFLHQTRAKTFSRWLLCRFHRSPVLVFHCSMSPKSSCCTKASESKAFKEKLHCPMSTHSLICQALGNTFSDFKKNTWTTTKWYWKELPKFMDSKDCVSAKTAKNSANVWIKSLCPAVCKA